ncbi:hypothetical protein CH063_11737 [Colletotrichum higginsianum]|uniref:Uncharacterized protein n=1 Tax=Colletotrichum higginsianum (strain IMI 349063) TaxID=759273 RepID=H1VML7_COLHI|nr:hypothetical protein CH063_11737 [Colletotrichum higginsianum]
MLGLDRSKSAELDPHVQASLSVRSGTRTDEMREKRAEGQRRAHEREMVRCAARRGVVFGFLVDGRDERRKCEAVMQGKVVEPSYAKGDWAVRWRED